MSEKNIKDFKLNDGFNYVWLNTNNGVFSNPFTKEEIEKYLTDKDLKNAEKDKWVLIEYRGVNNVVFEFNAVDSYKWVPIETHPNKSMKVQWLCSDGVQDIGFYDSVVQDSMCDWFEKNVL